jgi:hypothetical protein
LIFVVLVEKELEDVVEQLRDVLELLLLDTKAHCPLGHLE